MNLWVQRALSVRSAIEGWIQFRGRGASPSASGQVPIGPYARLTAPWLTLTLDTDTA